MYINAKITVSPIKQVLHLIDNQEETDANRNLTHSAVTLNVQYNGTSFIQYLNMKSLTSINKDAKYPG